MNTEPTPKPLKPTGILAELDEDQREQLGEWVNSTQTYKETMEAVKTNFGIQITSISVLKNFRKKFNAALLEDCPFCPPNIPREVWEKSLAKMKAVLEDEATKIELRVRVSAFLLQLARLTLDYNKATAKPRRIKMAKAKVIADSPNASEPNPLDDQNKIDEARLRVFGSVPE